MPFGFGAISHVPGNNVPAAAGRPNFFITERVLGSGIARCGSWLLNESEPAWPLLARANRLDHSMHAEISAVILLAGGGSTTTCAVPLPEKPLARGVKGLPPVRS